MGSQNPEGVLPLLMLSMLFVFNLFDLALTQSQIPRGNFNEMNYFAAGVVHCPVQTAAYKLVLFSTGALILVRFRKQLVAKIALGALTACYGGLMIWWNVYLDFVEVCLSDPTRGAAGLPL